MVKRVKELPLWDYSNLFCQKIWHYIWLSAGLFLLTHFIYLFLFGLLILPAWVRAKSLQSRPTLCDPMDHSPPALSSGFSRQEYLSGLLCLPPGDLPNPGIEPTSLMSPALADGFFTTSATWKAPVVPVCGLVAQSCLTICDPMDWSLPGSSVHGILQARILEWVAIPFSSYLPDPVIEPRPPTLQANSLPSEPPGKPPIVSDYISNISQIADHFCINICNL